MDEVIYEAAGNAYSRGPLSSTQEPEDATASFYGVQPFRERGTEEYREGCQSKHTR